MRQQQLSTRALLATCAAALALAGAALARRSCNTEQYGQQQGREVHIREQRMSPSMADWKIRIPPVCPKIVGVSATACDSDGAPTIHLSSERSGMVRRSGGLKTGAYVYITVFCDPDTISPHLLDLLTTPSPEMINLPSQDQPQLGSPPQGLPVPKLPALGLPGHPSYVMSPQYIPSQSWLQSQNLAGLSDPSNSLYPISPAFWTHQNLHSHNLQSSNYLNPPLRHPDKKENKGNVTTTTEPLAEKAKAETEPQTTTTQATDVPAQQPPLQSLEKESQPPQQVNLSPHQKQQKESLLKRIEHWWADHVRAWTSRRQARRMLMRQGQGNHIAAADPDTSLAWARRHYLDRINSHAHGAHRSNEMDDHYNYDIYPQNINIDDLS